MNKLVDLSYFQSHIRIYKWHKSNYDIQRAQNKDYNATDYNQEAFIIPERVTIFFRQSEHGWERLLKTFSQAHIF